jgi:asparagine synthase (glutamine-hydrolysing)
MAREFFGRGREQWAAPGFSHQTRWQGAAALQRLFRPDVRAGASRVDVVGRLMDSLPGGFGRWSFLAQDQYLEARTLLSGYLLSSQGDRMLMAHSVEGRFPFLDADVVELANSLPAAFKVRGLDEKHVLKRVARGLVPDEVIARPKQPYRSPDALSFVGTDAPDWIGALMSGESVRDAGVFEPGAVERLWRKCQASGGEGQFSNADNMALVGVLSTGLLHEQLVRTTPTRGAPGSFLTSIDRLSARNPGNALGERAEPRLAT